MELLQHTRNIMERKEEQRSSIRKRNLVVLVHGFLIQNGYTQTAKALRNETSVKIDQYTVCDNVDLDVVLQEYETFQYVKFRHYPNIVKSASFDEKRGTTVCLLKKPVAKTRPIAKVSCVTSCSPPDKELGNDKLHPDSCLHQSESDSQLARQGEKVGFGGLKNSKGSCSGFMRSLPSLTSSLAGINSEWRMLNEIISQDIFVKNPNVQWQDIVGLDNAKRIIKEAIMYPVQHPDLFRGLLAPWKGLLLYGPPGNGKTLLAKALATECKTTFFNISPSTVVSKWRGDSEKLIRVMFDMARQNAPSTIFLDEVDALMCTRDHGGNSEHEASRRMKTELLVQMDGLANTEDLVFVLAASNTPWDLDSALLRRLEKRVLVALPDKDARQTMFQNFLSTKITGEEAGLGSQLPFGDLDFSYLAGITEGYSAADIRLVCREAAMNNVRNILKKQNSNTDTASVLKLMPSITTAHIVEAIQCTRSTCNYWSDKYERWQQEFGSE